MKKGKAVLNAFIEIVNKFNRKPNKICVDRGYNFTINLFNNSQIYSTHNKSKSVITERFIKILKAKVLKNDRK